MVWRFDESSHRLPRTRVHNPLAAKYFHRRADGVAGLVRKICERDSRGRWEARVADARFAKGERDGKINNEF